MNTQSFEGKRLEELFKIYEGAVKSEQKEAAKAVKNFIIENFSLKASVKLKNALAEVDAEMSKDALDHQDKQRRKDAKMCAFDIASQLDVTHITSIQQIKGTVSTVVGKYERLNQQF